MRISLKPGKCLSGVLQWGIELGSRGVRSWDLWWRHRSRTSKPRGSVPQEKGPYGSSPLRPPLQPLQGRNLLLPLWPGLAGPPWNWDKTRWIKNILWGTQQSCGLKEIAFLGGLQPADQLSKCDTTKAYRKHAIHKIYTSEKKEYCRFIRKANKCTTARTCWTRLSP